MSEAAIVDIQILHVNGKKPRLLPKAPTSEAVARRLWMNSNYVPVKRFDSADYFLSKHHEQQRKLESDRDSKQDYQLDALTASTSVTCLRKSPLSPNVSSHPNGWQAGMR